MWEDTKCASSNKKNGHKCDKSNNSLKANFSKKSAKKSMAGKFNLNFMQQNSNSIFTA